MKRIMCLGLIGLLGLGNVSYASAQGVIPSAKITQSNLSLVKKNNVKIATKALKDKNEAIEYDLKIPIISGLKDKKIQDKLNKLFNNEIMKFKNELEKGAKSDLEDFKKEGCTFHPYVAKVEYKVSYNKNNILSICITYGQYTGGAHGMSYKKSYNIDLNTGNEATLKNFFCDGENYKQIIRNEIKRQIKLDEDRYFKGYDEVIDTLSDSQDFYIEDGKIVVYYGQYEIAPFAAGIPEFKIPFSLFKKGVKTNIDVKQSPIKVETKKISTKNEAFIGRFEIPVLCGINNKKVEEINKKIENDVMNFKKDIEDMAKEYSKDAKKEGWKIRPYDASTYYQVFYKENNILSISVTFGEYTGGAHGYCEMKTYNVDLETGKEIALKDIFKDGTNYKDIINKEIKKQRAAAAKQLKEDVEKNGEEYSEENALYFQFKGISEKQSFYIQQGSIVIYFGLYEIAPYSSGIPEFKISLSQFKDKVKDEFLSLKE
ncbi:DUF4163 domain-containing protein [Clostridium aestuarii]|uniref:DUF4163 domain-containing protein n=1 Tax=Clostridium aestuarii TaxID=338193 RepID=A0ABT4D193_9CLOT|nr:DUF4163 domain-containing protein [Clostridium aestuarii]MCY6485014.1 DUF4163 domain-containing protein [Clostridium aestuarii]